MALRAAFVRKNDMAVDNELRVNIADRINIQLNALGLSGSAIILRIKDLTPTKTFSQTTYYRTANAINNIQLETLGYFAEALEIPLADLFAGVNEAPQWARELNVEGWKNRVACRLQAEQKLLGFNDLEMSTQLDIVQQTYDLVSRGVSNFSIDNLAAIANGLHLRPSVFLFGCIPDEYSLENAFPFYHSHKQYLVLSMLRRLQDHLATVEPI